MQAYYEAGASYSEGRWASVDLHIHSVYSGGTLTPREIATIAHQKQLDGIAIADHFSVRGAGEAIEFAARHPFFPSVLPAQEVSAGDHFHLLIIGAEETWSDFNRRTIVEKITEHHRRGGVSVLAHPWTISRNAWAKECAAELIREGLLDGIELFNASILELGERADYALREFWEEWGKPYNLGILGGSDYHHSRNGREIGKGRTYLKVFHEGPGGIIDALRERRTVAGIIASQPIALSSMGEGHQLFLGNEPWFGEFMEMTRLVNNTLGGGYHLQSEIGRVAASLAAGGNYQAAYDCLNYGDSNPRL